MTISEATAKDASAAAHKPPRISRPSPNVARFMGSWRYVGGPRSRKVAAFAICLSAGLHAGLFLGIHREQSKALGAAPKSPVIELSLMLADLKDLEEPEPVSNDEPAVKLEPAEFVPMQADQPQVVQANDFVQELDFASLLPPPEMNRVKTFSIPDHINRTGKAGDAAVKIFDLSDLDRAPEAIVRPPPVYPQALVHDAYKATVVVEFVIELDGRVKTAFVVESTHASFDAAAIAGVEKWKYRPGIRQGRKVRTRMQVPIIFSVAAGEGA
jgi:TonB family protein